MGPCILLEQNIYKDMLCLACRHHIMEIKLEAVVVHAIGCSSGPDILLFKRFKNLGTQFSRNILKLSYPMLLLQMKSKIFLQIR